MTVGKFTHAIVSRVPKSYQSVPTIDGTCIDHDKARDQHQHLVQVLRDLSLDVLELPPDEDHPQSGTIALLCQHL